MYLSVSKCTVYGVRWICKISVALVFVLVSSGLQAAPLRQSLPPPVTAYSLFEQTLTIQEADYQLQRVDFFDEYVVLVGYITNNGDVQCYSRRDFRLQIGNQSYDMSPRNRWIEQAYGVNSPGSGFLTQCVSQGETELMVLPFQLSAAGGTTSLWYGNTSLLLNQALADLHAATVTAPPTPTPTLTPTRTPTSTPTVTFTPAAASFPVVDSDGDESASPFLVSPNALRIDVIGSVSNQDLEFELVHVDFWDVLPDGSTPANDYYAVVLGTLRRSGVDSSGSGCVGANDVELYVGDSRMKMARKLRAVNRHYNIEFPGFILPHCPLKGVSDNVLFAFDVANSTEPVALSFYKARLVFPNSLAALRENSRSVPLPTSTPEPTLTQVELQVSDSFIVDFRNLIGYPRAHVEEIFGEGSPEIFMEAGSLWTYDDPTIVRDYDFKTYTFSAYYDLDDVLRGLQIVDGLEEDGYRLADWPTLLGAVGLPSNIMPDKEARASLLWNSLEGYFVWIARFGTRPDDFVWTIQVWIDEDAALPESAPPATLTQISTSTPTAAGVACPQPNTNINVRSGPGTTYNVVSGASAGECLVITSRTSTGDWYQLSNGGWVAAFLIVNAPPASTIEVVEAVIPTPVPPTLAPPTATFTPVPQVVPPVPTQAPPPVSAVCDCSGDVYNCPHFSTQSQAQACMNYCIAQGVGDIHRLDRDNDGVACENLP